MTAPLKPTRGWAKKVYGYLEKEPLFRERKNKDRGLVNMLAKKYGILDRLMEQKIVSKETLVAIMQDYATADRAWRQILSRSGNAHLRGKDYASKEELEKQKQRELGYHV